MPSGTLELSFILLREDLKDILSNNISSEECVGEVSTSLWTTKLQIVMNEILVKLS